MKGVIPPLRYEVLYGDSSPAKVAVTVDEKPSATLLPGRQSNFPTKRALHTSNNAIYQNLYSSRQSFLRHIIDIVTSKNLVKKLIDASNKIFN